MKIFLVTLFPKALESYFETSIMKKAREEEFLDLSVVNIADFSTKNTRRADDRPYGGLSGTIIAPEPCAQAMEYCQSQASEPISWIVTDPRWETLTQKTLSELSRNEQPIGIVCGHYEGVDERVLEFFKARKVSLGNFVITGGELAGGVIIDGIVRLLPGLLSPESLREESFSSGIEGKSEYPQYTRPELWRGQKVPDVLLSGNHAEIEKWKRNNSH